jgi:hypothetical protein
METKLIHSLHGGASLVSLNQRSLSSALVHQVLLVDLCIQTNRPLTKDCAQRFRNPLRQFCVFGLGLLQNGDIGVGVFILESD